MQTLILKGSDIKPLASIKDIIQAVEEAFKQKGLGKVQMPPKTYLYFEKHGGDLRSMPSALESPEIAGVKVVNYHPNNRNLKLPSVMATIILIDPKTGTPLAIMDGTWITAMRTGAASAVAAKHLARKNCKTLGLVGTGTQAVTQLMGIHAVRPIQQVKAYDIYPEGRKAFVEKMSREYPDVTFQAVSSAEEAVKDSDILVTVTPAREPVVFNQWIQEGIHISAIGADAPGKEELDPAILKRAKIVVDDKEQTFHAGEINVPLKKGLIKPSDIYAELGDIVAGKAEARESDREITLFDSTGVAILDVVSAKLVYDRAVQKGVGLNLDLVSS
ncbi:MAG: alanine dehydrogenase [Thaumarchaeota archaeon]|nr:alanine dehydrogenase [Nitrososphaerota archaeon]